MRAGGGGGNRYNYQKSHQTPNKINVHNLKNIFQQLYIQGFFVNYIISYVTDMLKAINALFEWMFA